MSQPSLPSRAQYAREVLSMLYPAPLQVGPPASGVDALARFLLLPTPERVRLVVPAGRPAVSARVAHRQLTGRRVRTRVARLLVTAGVASGAADRLATGSLEVTGPAGSDSVERVLEDVLGRIQVLLGLPVSPPRSNRKPVLQVCDPAGQVLAFVKVGHDALTRRLVADEGAALTRLASAGLRRVQVPRVLGHQEWNGLSLLVLEPLRLDGRRRTGGTARRDLLAVVRDIAEVGGTAALPWRATPFRTVLHDQVQACGSRAAALFRELAAVDAADPVLRTGSWHGDLNPGNIALLRHRTPVWDWERFEHGVPWGFDLLHHDLHRDVATRGATPREAARRLLADAPATLRELGVGEREATATARLYLLALAARYLRDRQSAAGGGLGDIDTWLLPALADPAALDLSTASDAVARPAS